MEQNKRTIEKILTQALELHEKGVSLHSIVRTYPTYKDEIEEMFSAMALVSKKSVLVDVPEAGLERLLRALPEDIILKNTQPIQSPFSTFWSSMHMTNWKFLVPVAALALLTGGLIVSKHSAEPLNPTVNQKLVATTAPSGSITPGTQPMGAATTQTPTNTTDQTVAMLLGSSSAESSVIANETASERTTATSDAAYLNNPAQPYAN